MHLNRELQRTMLNSLAGLYPSPVYQNDSINFADLGVVRNLVYLEQHGLVQLNKAQYQDGSFSIGAAVATAKGMDFLEEDGGLSAILGVVTIRLHDDTIKDLIALKIRESAMPAEEKQRWTDALKELPAEGIKHVTMKLIDLGLDNASLALPAIKGLLGIP